MTTSTDNRRGAAGSDGFGRLVLAEWTKLRTVPRWSLTLVAAVALTVIVSMLGASSGSTGEGGRRDATPGPDGRAVHDQFEFVHQPLMGDGSVTARVRTQAGVGAPSHEWAKAGVMLKERAEPGAPYAAVMVTPGHGVRMQSNFTTDVAGSRGPVPRWLRLTRSGTAVTGEESADGTTWTRIATVDLHGLPSTVEVGLFVTSPVRNDIRRQFGSSSVDFGRTVSTATFDGVRVEPAQRPTRPAAWTDQRIGRVATGEAAESAGTFTVTGSGDVAPDPPAADVVKLSLTGIMIGLVAVLALGVLFITTEYRRGMIRTTFAASPRRGRVLAAKAVVIGAVTFVAGLMASIAAFAVAQPILRSNGFRPPSYPIPSLADWPVLRAVVGTAALVSLVAVLGLGVGTILRHSAGAIAAIIVLLVVPQLVIGALPLSAARWLLRVTPAAGFAIQQASDRYDFVSSVCLPEDGCYPEGPWPGFAVLCGYAAVTLAVAVWLVHRRDA